VSAEISKKDAAVVSAAIAAYLAEPTTTKAATSSQNLAQLQRRFKVLSERMEALEKKVYRLETSVNDASRRVEEMRER
jgi:predicted  nucleic acid-binding Zn-ribbon protein